MCHVSAIVFGAKALSPKEIRSPRIVALVENMRETMRAAPGVGLAAPQIGESLQLAVTFGKFVSNIPLCVASAF